MRWILQFALLCFVLLFGVFFGIDKAEQNMQAIQGTGGTERVLEVTVPEDGKMEISVLGEAYETEQPISEAQFAKGKNFFSHLGNKIGEGLQWIARQTLNRFFELVDKLTP